MKTMHNSRFAIGGVSCSVDSFVVKESSVLRMNIGAKKPAPRKSAKRYLGLKRDCEQILKKSMQEWLSGEGNCYSSGYY